MDILFSLDLKYHNMYVSQFRNNLHKNISLVCKSVTSAVILKGTLVTRQRNISILGMNSWATETLWLKVRLIRSNKSSWNSHKSERGPTHADVHVLLQGDHVQIQPHFITFPIGYCFHYDCSWPLPIVSKIKPNIGFNKRTVNDKKVKSFLNPGGEKPLPHLYLVPFKKRGFRSTGFAFVKPSDKTKALILIKIKKPGHPLNPLLSPL